MGRWSRKIEEFDRDVTPYLKKTYIMSGYKYYVLEVNGVAITLATPISSKHGRLGVLYTVRDNTPTPPIFLTVSDAINQINTIDMFEGGI